MQELAAYVLGRDHDEVGAPTQDHLESNLVSLLDARCGESDEENSRPIVLYTSVSDHIDLTRIVLRKDSLYNPENEPVMNAFNTMVRHEMSCQWPSPSEVANGGVAAVIVVPASSPAAESNRKANVEMLKQQAAEAGAGYWNLNEESPYLPPPEALISFARLGWRVALDGCGDFAGFVLEGSTEDEPRQVPSGIDLDRVLLELSDSPRAESAFRTWRESVTSEEWQ